MPLAEPARDVAPQLVACYHRTWYRSAIPSWLHIVNEVYSGVEDAVDNSRTTLNLANFFEDCFALWDEEAGPMVESDEVVKLRALTDAVAEAAIAAVNQAWPDKRTPAPTVEIAALDRAVWEYCRHNGRKTTSTVMANSYKPDGNP
jgi:hypothetical protein